MKMSHHPAIDQYNAKCHWAIGREIVVSCTDWSQTATSYPASYLRPVACYFLFLFSCCLICCRNSKSKS